MIINVRTAKYCKYCVTEIESSIHQPTMHSFIDIVKKGPTGTHTGVYLLLEVLYFTVLF